MKYPSVTCLFLIFLLLPIKASVGFPAGANGKEPTCQCRRPKRCEFDPWIRKIP